MASRQTPSQTVGPFFRPSLIEAGSEKLVQPETRGDRITIEGSVMDGDGAPVTDAMIEIWQANAEGRYDHIEDDQEKLLDPVFHGYGRAGTDAHGAFRFETIKPGAVPGTDGVLQAPHINVSIFARGLLKRLCTRIYFPDDPLNETDLVLITIAPERRATLIASRVPNSKVMRFDIILQGTNETVFFDV
jgi:protocatechuate 3,4-dioxygenase alpha subunit